MDINKKIQKQNKKHIKLFERIASPYAWFFKGQQESYTELITKYKERFSMKAGDKVLDLGCGTGALSTALLKNGFKVSALDASKNMLAKAKQLCNDDNINFIHQDISKGIPLPDKSFDFVFAAYLAHGLSPSLRQILYKEALRLAEKKFILYDYLPNNNLIVSLIEWLEGGDYFYFKKNVNKEIEALGKKYEIIPLSSHAAFYVIDV